MFVQIGQISAIRLVIYFGGNPERKDVLVEMLSEGMPDGCIGSGIGRVDAIAACR
jgi:hypothetical protein